MKMEAFNNPPPLMMTSPYTSSALSYSFPSTKNTTPFNPPLHSSSDVAMCYPNNLVTTTTTTASTSSPRSSSGSPWMDPRIWCRLPQPIMDRVIAVLPPPAFFRSRAVCKRWYSLLYSPSFLQLYLHLVPRHRHWFLFFPHAPCNDVVSTATATATTTTATEAYLFDPYELTWHRLAFPFLPAGFSPAASSSGLLCWVSDDAGPKSIFLQNPLQGYNSNYSMTHLPPTLKPRLFPSIGLAVSADYWSSLDVVLAGDDMVSPYAVKNLSTESFRVDARGVRAWAASSALPRLCSLESRQMAYCRSTGRFFCMNHSPFGVLCYDVASAEWTKLQAPMRRFLRCPSLVESRGEVVLVAAVEKSKLNVPRSLRIWRLCGAQWVEVDRMPQQMYAQFEEVERSVAGGPAAGSSKPGFDCVGHGEFTVITVRGAGSKAAVMFDGVRKRWMWMPPCPFVGGSTAQLHGFAYEPRLATPVTALLDHHFAIPT